MNEFYCVYNKLIIYGQDTPVEPNTIENMCVEDLLSHRIQMHGREVRLEILASGSIRFEFAGADLGLEFSQKERATELLNGLKKLGGFYNSHSQQLSF